MPLPQATSKTSQALDLPSKINLGRPISFSHYLSHEDHRNLSTHRVNPPSRSRN